MTTDDEQFLWWYAKWTVTGVSLIVLLFAFEKGWVR